MTRRRWIADESHENTAALVGDHAAHLARVLRAQVGQKFDIAANGTVRCGTITAISDARVDFTLGEAKPVKSTADLTLALSIFKFDRMEWAIEKCTEIGVTRIIPVIAHRTDSHLAQAATKRRERWQRLALQASEQSRRTAPPEILMPAKLSDLNPGRSSTTIRIVLAESERNTRLGDLVAEDSPAITLAVGPEGGWTSDELKWFHDSGWAQASLGDHILRTETAAIVATAIVLDALQ